MQNPCSWKGGAKRWHKGRVDSKNVIHASDMQKNLVYNSLLRKNGLSMVLSLINFFLTRVGCVVDKWYLCNELFKLNVMTITLKNKINQASSTIYLVKSSDLWHDRFVHVNYKILKRTSNLDLLLKSYVDQNKKSKIYVESKLTKSPSYFINKSNEPLDLIHIDICDSKFLQTRDEKKFIIFINNCTRYYSIYLLWSKGQGFKNVQTF